MSSNISQLLQTGLEFHQSGRLQEAEGIYQSILKEQPRHPDALHLLGVLAHQIGKNEIAVRLIEDAIKINPDEADFYNNCGEAYRALQENEMAIARYEQAIIINADFAGAHNNLGNALRELGRLEDAISRYEKTISIAPDFPMAYNNLGIALKELGRPDEAVSRYEQALVISPDYAEAHNNLGNALKELGRQDEAIHHFKQALTIIPHYAEAHSNLGNALMELDQREKAISHYERAIAIKPNFAMAHYNLGIALEEQGRPEEAVSCYQQAINIKPDYAEAYNNLGFALQELGRQNEAINSYKKVLAIKPDYAAAHLHLSMIIPEREQASVIEKLLKKPALSEIDATHYHFALGNIYNNIEMFNKAFEHYNKANNLKRKSITYKSQSYSTYVNRLIETCSKDYFQGIPSYGSDSELPVFIVGMPRSGTTLVEQIISSHPQVYGAGELAFMGNIVSALANQFKALRPYPECISLCNEAVVNNYSKKYLKEISDFSKEATRITDKDPGNFHRIGLIKTLFPKARIIHCRRNPLDNCTSIFFNYFSVDNEYSFDLNELGQYYLDYKRMMTHWNSLFPSDILEVQYEELVVNQEKISRQLIGHISLNWDERCLDFHLGKRAVRTASNVQVRKPIYTHSVNRWKRYEKHLSPLMAILQDA